MSALNDDELARYARHIVMREIGGSGQRALKSARVAVIGAGGLGSPALMYLAAAGVGRLRVIDDDEVAVSNLQRQVIHGTGRVGAPKTDSAAAAIAALNPHVEVETRTARIAPDNAAELIAGADVVLDGSDNFDTRYLVNETCVAAGAALVSAAIAQWEGQITVHAPGAPCYACVHPTRPAEGLAPSCAEAGVIGPLPGVMGSMMAVEAIKLITGAGRPLTGRLMIYDALDAAARVFETARAEECPVCGGGWG